MSNVILHLVNVWLVYKLAEKLSGKSVTALVVSVLFALHPMHVESVAWISERKDVLYTFFYLSALLVYIRYITSGYRLKHYLFALFLFILSLLSKSAAVTLPLLLIAVDIYLAGYILNKRTGDNKNISRAVNNERKIITKLFLQKLPFLLFSLLFGTRANIKLLMEDFTGSIEDYNFSLTLKPNTGSVYFNRAFAKLKQNDLSGACKDWKKASSLGFGQAEKMRTQYCPE